MLPKQRVAGSNRVSRSNDPLQSAESPRHISRSVANRVARCPMAAQSCEGQVKRLTRIHQALISALAATAISIILSVDPAAAHQPFVPGATSSIVVTDPTISKAYYAELKGQPDTYHISSDASFVLYLNVLVPAIASVTEDYTLTIVKDGERLAVVVPGTEAWKAFDEPFGRDRYLMGAEYRQRVPSGHYDIVVSSPDNVGKYVMAIGEVESFSMSEVLRTMTTMVAVKHYFGKPAIAVFESPFISVPLVVVLLTIGTITFLILLRRRRHSQQTDS